MQATIERGPYQRKPYKRKAVKKFDLDIARVDAFIRKRGLNPYRASMLFGISTGLMYDLLNGRCQATQHTLERISVVMKVKPESLILNGGRNA